MTVQLNGNGSIVSIILFKIGKKQVEFTFRVLFSHAIFFLGNTKKHENIRNHLFSIST